MVTWKPKSDIDRARRLRTERATEAEKLLWSKLRSRQMDGVKFRRQHPVGPYVLDFVCIERSLAVEVDGGQHADPAQAEYDRRRTDFLAAEGFEVLRFWNNDVLGNIEGVWDTICARLAQRPSPPGPLSRKRARG
ncbi:MAG TPA: endonuclease domain-containing protein, partial [Candidatus Omnitrophota bacterium]|nr:endonuclease domain-containing protein [Candidatus Omnitrophota bacterium]